MLTGLAASAAAMALLMFALWLYSLAREDVSVVDLFWGPGSAVVAWVCLATAEAPTARAWLGAALVTLWALRLAVYLGWRNHGKPEDYRYAAMRRRAGPSFRWRSLYVVFGFQGALILLVSLPLNALATLPGPPLGPLDALAASIFAVGLFFEAVGDWQLARFKADPASKGKVMDRGLWRYTRHPNYFGDFAVWWGLWLLAAPVAPWTVIAPLVMSVLLLRVSGVALLESTIVERRPEYADYIRRTSPFFPWFPKEPADPSVGQRRGDG